VIEHLSRLASVGESKQVRVALNFLHRASPPEKLRRLFDGLSARQRVYDEEPFPCPQ
jgi:hypothetical protein